jgi:transcriptional regulator with GAF, ATPase, and Fis domain
MSGTSLNVDRYRRLAESGDVEQALEMLLGAACQFFRCAGAGLMLVDQDQALQFQAATDGGAEKLERLQVETGEGPCVDAVIRDRVTRTADLQADDRWPQLIARLTGSDVHAVMGVPVHFELGPIGSLDIYLSEPHEWDEDAERALETYAQVCATVLGIATQAVEQGELAAQLRRALESRVRIERAVGVLMGRYDLDAVVAFEQLRKAARDRGIKAATVAERILDGGWPLD